MDRADTGRVRWDPARSLWFGSMTAGALILGPLTWTPSAFALFAVTTSITLCAGHSVGLHRGIIHRSFRSSRALEHLLAYLAVLVGLGGIRGLVRMHNTRDAQQTRPRCHDYFAHRRGLLLDAAWNLHCRFEFDGGFTPRLDPAVEGDRFYGFLERTWRLQQLPWALLFLAVGGWSWVIWGVVVRVFVGTTGHWFVGHLAHRRGRQRWVVRGAGVQGWNLPLLGALSMGEGWHNNHHAFPRSARMGLGRWEIDPGWLLVRAMRALGLVWDVHVADAASQRGNVLSTARAAAGTNHGRSRRVS
jgi:stearoyl-CoA desaturase (delta-9 desaturase)